MLTLLELESLVAAETPRTVSIGGRDLPVRDLKYAEIEEMLVLIPEGPGSNIRRNALHAALALGLELDNVSWDTSDLGVRPLPEPARKPGTPAKARADYARAAVAAVLKSLPPETVLAACEPPGRGGKASSSSGGGPGSGTP